MTKEHAIQNSIRLWLSEHGYVSFRCNVGKVLTADGIWFDTGLPNGFSDLLVIGSHGDTYFIECKAPGGRQRPDQKKFEELVTGRGFIYILAYSIEDVAKSLLKNH